MGSDWIKMRTDLYRDPKVILMADSLMDLENDLARYVNQNMQCNMSVTRNVTRNAVVGALVSVWGVARHDGHRENDDLRLDGVTVHVLDDIADMPGFGEAMSDAGWVRQDDLGLVFPRFFEKHNVEPGGDAKAQNRERQRRYRERKRNALRNVTVASQNNAREREEKEKSITPLNPPKGKRSPKSVEVQIPESLDTTEFAEAWSEWLAYRRERKATCSPRTLTKQLAMLADLGPPTAIQAIQASITNGWQGIFPPKHGNANGRSRHGAGPGQRHPDDAAKF